MVGRILLRGMLAGLAAGLLTFSCAKFLGEPQVDHAISFEQKMDEAKGEAPEPELVSRHTQAGLGLFTGVMVYSTAVGGLFALVFAFLQGRVGSLSPRALAGFLALGGFVALVLAPMLKYPANPPSVGNPDTIGFRTELYFLMLAISVAAMVFSLKVRRYAVRKIGAWNGSIAAAVLFIVIIALVDSGLPIIDEVPAAFPAMLLWKFRLAALGMQVILWSTIGLVFGALIERMQGQMFPSNRVRKSTAFS